MRRRTVKVEEQNANHTASGTVDKAIAIAKRNALVVENLPLVRAIVSRSYARASMEADDLVQIGCLGLLEAADSYRPRRGRFSVWASLHINACIRKELKLDKRRPESGSNDAGLAALIDPDGDLPDLDLDVGALLVAVESLPPEYRRIIIRSYGLDLKPASTVRDLAKSRRCSTRAICSRKREAVDHLREKLTA